MLKGKQKKLDKNKDGKISGEDFKMMKAKDGKSVKTFEELQKFGVTTKKSPKENGFKEDLNRQLRRAEAKQKLSRRGILSDRARKDLQDGIYPKDLSKLKGAVSEKELSRLQNLAEKKSKGGAMTKAKDGKSIKTSKTLEKFAGKKVMKDLGQLKGALSEKELKDLQDGIYPKDLGKLKGAVSEKELNFIRGLNKSKGGAIKKAKYGKMMKASKGSMISSEGPTNKVRGTGIAVRGTNFKGIF